MRRRPLESLGGLVRARRGSRTLREVARSIGIGPATVLRVESGRIPDVATFGRICAWLGVDPSEFLGAAARGTEAQATSGEEPIEISVHLRVDPTPHLETMQALAHMLLRASRVQPAKNEPDANEHA